LLPSSVDGGNAPLNGVSTTPAATSSAIRASEYPRSASTCLESTAAPSPSPRILHLPEDREICDARAIGEEERPIGEPDERLVEAALELGEDPRSCLMCYRSATKPPRTTQNQEHLVLLEILVRRWSWLLLVALSRLL
jgi:hypothetical protein